MTAGCHVFGGWTFSSFVEKQTANLSVFFIFETWYLSVAALLLFFHQPLGLGPQLHYIWANNYSFQSHWIHVWYICLHVNIKIPFVGKYTVHGSLRIHLHLFIAREWVWQSLSISVFWQNCFALTITNAQAQLIKQYFSLKQPFVLKGVRTCVYLGDAPDCAILVQLEIDTNSNALHHKSWRDITWVEMKRSDRFHPLNENHRPKVYTEIFSWSLMIVVPVDNGSWSWYFMITYWGWVANC